MIGGPPWHGCVCYVVGRSDVAWEDPVRLVGSPLRYLVIQPLGYLSAPVILT